MDLILIMLIIYILKNNNSQCYYVQNRNLRLLLLLVCIHNMNHCLNTNYRYMNSITNKNKYCLNYPNEVSNNSNNVTNSRKNNTINDDNKDSIIYSDNDSIINKNTNKNISNNKDSNPDTLKNNVINPTAKIHTESSTYKDPYEKDDTITSINNTFTHLTLTKSSTSINQLEKHFNINNPLSLTNLKAKLPVLVGSTNITEIFHGNVNFCKPIISILKVTNEIFITDKSVLPTIHTNSNNAVLHYEGFLKTQLEYLEDVNIDDYQIKCDSKHYIMLIPFCGSKELTFSDEIIKSSDIVIKDFTLDVNKSKFSVDTCLEEPVKANQYINLYKTCNLTVKVECDISLYRKNIITL